MNINAFKPAATRVLGRSLLVLKKYSPEILTTVGVVGVTAAAVMGARATLKLEPEVDKIRERLDIIRVRKDDEEYSNEDRTKDLTYTYVTGALDIAKLYGPSVGLGVASIGAILGAHGIMRRRNVALLAAYKTLEEGFSAYRKRVREEVGDIKDREYLMGTVSEEVTDESTGVTTTVVKPNTNGISAYAKFFDKLNVSWSPIPDQNLLFLKCQQNYANDLLNSRGHVFLNEVYTMLNMEHTKGGALVGWVREGEGDGFIDFGIFDPTNEAAREFVNGYEEAILLDFNVDGIIYDQI